MDVSHGLKNNRRNLTWHSCILPSTFLNKTGQPGGLPPSAALPHTRTATCGAAQLRARVTSPGMSGSPGPFLPLHLTFCRVCDGRLLLTFFSTSSPHNLPARRQLSRR